MWSSELIAAPLTGMRPDKAANENPRPGMVWTPQLWRREL